MAIEQQETGTEATPVVAMTTRASDKLKEIITKQWESTVGVTVK